METNLTLVGLTINKCCGNMNLLETFQRSTNSRHNFTAVIQTLGVHCFITKQIVLHTENRYTQTSFH